MIDEISIDEIYLKLKKAADEKVPIDITMVEPDKYKARQILDKVYQKCKDKNISISIIEYFYDAHFRHIPPSNGTNATHFLAFIYIKSF